MATNWTTITGADLPKVLDLAVLLKANQNIDSDSQDAAFSSGKAPDRFDPTLADRIDASVQLQVRCFRAAIAAGGRVPISVTADALPDDLALLALNCAAYQLVNSTPNLQMVVINDAGIYAPLQTMYNKAQVMLGQLRNGATVLSPTDPTGGDYLTAVSDTNPAICKAATGSRYNDQVDLTLD